MEGDGNRCHFGRTVHHFNPLPPHGGRLCDLVLFLPLYISFQSTPSAWRETHAYTVVSRSIRISIHSLRMEGDILSYSDRIQSVISIHSLRMEGDRRRKPSESCWTISIHSLRMEGDRFVVPHMRQTDHFNPLPPHGGRRIVLFWIVVLWHFNPLPPHGGRLHNITSCAAPHHFNPLPPHGGRPCAPYHYLAAFQSFQSTPSAWRETVPDAHLHILRFISIHSLRMEGDDALCASALVFG